MAEPKPDNYFFVKEYRGRILYRGIDENGNYMDNIYKFKPTYYIKSKKTRDAVSIFDENLKEYKFDSIREAKEWREEQENLNIPVYGDIKIESQFISELPQTKPCGADEAVIMYYDIETTVGEYSEGFPTPDKALEEITVITAYDTQSKQMHVFTSRPFDVDYSIDEVLAKYDIVEHVCDNEKDLLKQFFKYVYQLKPHFISGWNIDGFDNLYVYNRIKNVLGEEVAKRISPFNVVNIKRKQDDYGNFVEHVEWYGVISYDMMHLYKQYTYGSVPDYKLDTIAELELGKKKLSYDGSFKDFYQNDWDRFVAYNIRDVALVVELAEKTSLIDVGIAVAHECWVSCDETFGSVAKLDSGVYKFAKQQGKVIPPKTEKEWRPYVGGYVKEPITGKLHKGIVSYDFTSLYPSIVRDLNISPETIVENPPEEIAELAEKIKSSMKKKDTAIAEHAYIVCDIDMSVLDGTDYVISPIGIVYDKSKKGIIPEFITYIFNQRKYYKNEAKKFEKLAKDESNENEKKKYEFLAKTNDIKQLVFKILINSLYGCLANKHFRYFDIRNAESITAQGQCAIQYVSRNVVKWLEDKFGYDDYWIATDTDSSIFAVPKLVEMLHKKFNGDHDKMVDGFVKFADGVLQDVVNDLLDAYAKYRNANGVLAMDREVVSVHGGFWTVKKRYAIYVDDMEGVRFSKENPKKKIMGLEISRTSQYPKPVRDVFMKAIDLIIREQDEGLYQDFVKQIKKEFHDWEPEQIAFRVKMTDFDDRRNDDGSWCRGASAQHKAAWAHNELLRIEGIDSVAPIKPGDGIYWVYLKQPNKWKFEAFGFVEWRKEYEVLRKYIDYITMWQKVLEAPLKRYAEAVGWKIEKPAFKLFG